MQINIFLDEISFTWEGHFEQFKLPSLLLLLFYFYSTTIYEIKG